jgi:hypothetical protein
MKHFILAFSIFLFEITFAAASLSLDPLFTDHAVLQAGQPIVICGTGTPGSDIEITLAGHSTKAKVINAKWEATFPAMAPGGPHEIEAKSNDGAVRAKDILVGEVWLCSGQSNMEQPLGPIYHTPQGTVEWEKQAAQADFPKIREFHVSPAFPEKPAATYSGEWKVCSPRPSHPKVAQPDNARNIAGNLSKIHHMNSRGIGGYFWNTRIDAGMRHQYYINTVTGESHIFIKTPTGRRSVPVEYDQLISTDQCKSDQRLVDSRGKRSAHLLSLLSKLSRTGANFSHNLAFTEISGDSMGIPNKARCALATSKHTVDADMRGEFQRDFDEQREARGISYNIADTIKTGTACPPIASSPSLAATKHDWRS